MLKGLDPIGVIMKKRKKLSRGKSKKIFKKGQKIKKKNVTPAPTRGGYRL